MIILSHFIQFCNIMLLLLYHSKFYISILDSFKFCIFWTDNVKAMVKDKKPIAQLPIMKNNWNFHFKSQIKYHKQKWGEITTMLLKQIILHLFADLLIFLLDITFSKVRLGVKSVSETSGKDARFKISRFRWNIGNSKHKDLESCLGFPLSSWGRIFSLVRLFYERAVSDLDP